MPKVSVDFIGKYPSCTPADPTRPSGVPGPLWGQIFEFLMPLRRIAMMQSLDLVCFLACWPNEHKRILAQDNS